jgi:hypothetical protein
MFLFRVRDLYEKIVEQTVKSPDSIVNYMLED